MDNRKKIILYASIVFLSLLVLVAGASYAYFSVTSTNSFGSKTISASAPQVGSVSLISDVTNVTATLSSEQMMLGNGGFYYLNENGTFGLDTWSYVQLAHTQVTGPGTYNCSYTMNVSATGTNNLYTAFQNWENKSDTDIHFYINHKRYSFYTANLFPITYTGELNGITASKSNIIKAGFNIYNKGTVDQSVLKNKDITFTFTVNSFSCNIASEPYYYVYDSTKSSNGYISSPLRSNAGLTAYLKGYSANTYDEICGSFSGSEVCFRANPWHDRLVYKAEMEALGATCSLGESWLICEDETTYCRISREENRDCVSQITDQGCFTDGNWNNYETFYCYED